MYQLKVFCVGEKPEFKPTFLCSWMSDHHILMVCTFLMAIPWKIPIGTYWTLSWNLCGNINLARIEKKKRKRRGWGGVGWGGRRKKCFQVQILSWKVEAKYYALIRLKVFSHGIHTYAFVSSCWTTKKATG